MAKMSKAEREAIGAWRWNTARALADAVIYARPGLRKLPVDLHYELVDDLAAYMLAAGDHFLDESITIEEVEPDAADIIALPTAGSA